MKSLIIGGGGFLGKNLAELLLSKGQAVSIFERTSHGMQQLPRYQDIEWFYGDYHCYEDISPALENIDTVYLFASTTTPKTSNDNYCHDINSNLIASVKFLEIACKHGIRKIIFPSSGGTIYGIPESTPINENHPVNPICSYGINKLAIEKYLSLFYRINGLEYTVLRISNPYGPYQPVNSGQGVITTFLHNVLHNKTIEIWGDGSVIRDYIYVTDVTRALWCAANNTSEQRVFNIGSGTGYSLNEILCRIEEHLGGKAKKLYLEGRLLDVPKNILDISKAKQYLNWEPSYKLDAGLEETIKWLNNQKMVGKI
jgi:UDP-glucose 4-epimerase